MYSAIIDLAGLNNLLPAESVGDFSIPDRWSKAKSRSTMNRYIDCVLERSSNGCVVCGSKLAGLVEAAHLSPYATDVKNRSNPANGICLCKYCHRALDLRLIAITPDGELLVDSTIDDPVAIFHFGRLDSNERKTLLFGVDPKFLNLTVQWQREYLPNKTIKVMP